MPAHPMVPGPFITFEGVDGSGKTTQLQRLAARLRHLGHTIVETREPGGTPLGEQIRQWVLQPREQPPAPRAELSLMFAARAELCARLIAPARARGEWVLCDRFTDASEAYQGAGRGLGMETVRRLHAALCPEHWPDLTFFLDVPLATSLARARRRLTQHGSGEGRFESEPEEFFHRIRQAYCAIAAREPQRFRTIAADADEAAVAAAIWDQVQVWLGSPRPAVP